MKNRRNFFKTLGFAGIGLSLGTCTEAKNPDAPIEPESSKPIIISTWDHGIPANGVGWKILSDNGTAIDAVEQAVRLIEDDPANQTVGIGGFPDREGNVTLDACIMKGNGDCGSVAFLQNIQNPISVARKVMEETPHIMLVGSGAKKFALAQGFTETDLLTEETKRDYEEWLKKSEYKPIINIENHDTISTLALDANGKLAGACTTSGAAWKMHGRVGDSPIIGAGLFVDGEVGAAAATGLGEAVIRTAGSAMVVEQMRNGKDVITSCKIVTERIAKMHKNVEHLQVGFIALDKHGNAGGYALRDGFSYAIYSSVIPNDLQKASFSIK